LILRDDARQRNRQVVAQREICLAARLVFAALENLENEPVALFPASGGLNVAGSQV
jgi:hypothetical protein